MATEREQEPVVLELASLPREQVGPFLLLGLDKDASQKQIEAHWAQRIIWARKNQMRAALQEINWAREVINDPAKRVRADVTSLNPDTTTGALHEILQRLGVDQSGGPAWRPLDGEKSLADYTPEMEIPDPKKVRDAIHVPEVPQDVPGVACLLEEWIQEPIDPWALDLPSVQPTDGNAEEAGTAPELNPGRQDPLRGNAS